LMASVNLLTVVIHEGKNLPDGDKRSFCSPFVCFDVCDSVPDQIKKKNLQHQTEVKKRTVNPIWNEKFEIAASLDKVLLFVVCNKGHYRAETLGYVDVPLSCVSQPPYCIKEWFNVKSEKWGNEGRLLLEVRDERCVSTAIHHPMSQDQVFNQSTTNLFNVSLRKGTFTKHPLRAPQGGKDQPRSAPQTGGFPQTFNQHPQSPPNINLQPPSGGFPQQPQSGGFQNSFNQQPTSGGFPQNTFNQQPTSGGFPQETFNQQPRSGGFPQNTFNQQPPTSTIHIQPPGGFNQQPSSGGFPQNTFSQPTSGSFPQNTFNQQPQNTPNISLQPPSGGFNQPPSVGFPQPPQSTCFPQNTFNQQPRSGGFPQNTFNQQPPSSLNINLQPPSTGFPQPPQSGGFNHQQSGNFNQQPHSGGFPNSGGFNQPHSGGFPQPPQSTYFHQNETLVQYSQSMDSVNTRANNFQTQHNFQQVHQQASQSVHQQSGFPGMYNSSPQLTVISAENRPYTSQPVHPTHCGNPPNDSFRSQTGFCQ